MLKTHNNKINYKLIYIFLLFQESHLFLLLGTNHFQLFHHRELTLNQLKDIQADFQVFAHLLFLLVFFLNKSRGFYSTLLGVCTPAWNCDTNVAPPLIAQ